MNQQLLAVLQKKGLDEYDIHRLFRYIQQTVFSQFNPQSHVVLKDLFGTETYHETWTQLDVTAEPTLTMEFQPYRYVLEHKHIGFRGMDGDYQLRIAYSGQLDTLYIHSDIYKDPYVPFPSFRRARPRARPRQLPCCPRCGHLDFEQYGGSRIPKFLRVKTALTCKQCNHTAHSQEFKT